MAAADSNAHLSLGRESVVVGTNVMRADLSLNRGGAGFRVVVALKTRNILFIEPGQKAARWLLPDNDHIMSDSSDIRVAATNGNAQRMIATAVLVKSTTGSTESVSGKLLLFAPSGRTIVEVANNVRNIHPTSLSGGDLTILYERNRRLVLAAFDPGSLAKRGSRRSTFPNPSE